MNVFLLLLLFGATAFADQFDSKTWRKVKIYDMPELGKLDPPPLGHIVGLKFNYRHERIDQPHISWYLGSVWRIFRGQQKEDVMHVSVMVRERDLPAFKAITTNRDSTQTRIIYGEPEYYRESSFVFLRVIGTKVKRGKNGTVTVSW